MKRTGLLFTLFLLLLAVTACNHSIKEGNVVGVYELEFRLEASMTFEQFEAFFQEEYIPALEKNFPEAKIYLLKGERGARTGKYTEIVIFNSLEDRNKYYPEPGVASEEAIQAQENMRELQERINAMIINSTFTDYVVR